jgi:hypothetical protein
MSIYADRILSSVGTSADPSDAAWVRFLKDHRKYLLDNSNTVPIGSELSSTFRFHLAELLKEKQIDPKNHWIIVWLNQLEGEWGTIDLDYILVPRDAALINLWDKYKSFIQKKEKAS